MAYPPIITNEKGDVCIFESVSDAEAYVEPIDVENGEYSIFDSRGLLLIPIVMEDGLGVRLVDSAPPDYRPDELVTVLRRNLSAMGETLSGVAEDEIWRMSLEGLLACRQRIKERHRKRKRSFWPWRRS